MRVIRSTVDGVGASTPRKRVVPSKLIPKPFAEPPTVFGVEPAFQGIAGLQVAEGRFFSAADDAAAAPVAVLGEGARVALFGGRAALGEHVKVNEQWLQRHRRLRRAWCRARAAPTARRPRIATT